MVKNLCFSHRNNWDRLSKEIKRSAALIARPSGSQLHGSPKLSQSRPSCSALCLACMADESQLERDEELLRELEREELGREGEAVRPAAPAAACRKHEGDEPTRRLRRKTTVGHLALGVALLAVAAGAPATAPAPVKLKDGFLTEEGLSAEDSDARKTVWHVTLPHPRVALESGNAAGLKAPEAHDRGAIAQIILDVFSNPVYVDAASASRGGQRVAVEKFVVFREPHAKGDDGIAHAHYHIAIKVSSPVRFAAYKRALRMRHNLASHWSSEHEGYWSAVRYGVLPTPTKPQDGLDLTPAAWCRDGPHPPLFDAAQDRPSNSHKSALFS